jgi:thiol-disulfide isomerase/thioredoxin
MTPGRLRQHLALGATLVGVAALIAWTSGAFDAGRKAMPGASGQQGSFFQIRATPSEIAELSFEDAAGQRRTLADFRGRYVLLNIWATWCAPCREEMPALDRLQASLGGADFEVVALSLDQQGRALAPRFFSEMGIKALKVYVDSSAQAASKLGAVGVPTTLLVDREGREIARRAGPAKWDAPEVLDELRSRIHESAKR